jgi:hypothetical protein
MIKTPFNPYAGPLSDFKRHYPGVPEWKWWHGQMRSWAYSWRDRNATAALLGRPAADLAETYLYLAKTYRATFLKLRDAI